MEKYYRIKIKKKKTRGREQLVYPKRLAKAHFQSLRYTKDFSEAVIKVDASNKVHNELKTEDDVQLLKANEIKTVEKELSPPPVIEPDTQEDIPVEEIPESPTASRKKWITPKTLLNNWKNYSSKYNPFGFIKDNDGFVHLRGLVKGGSTEGNNSQRTIFILPEFYRPAFRQLYCVMTNPNAAGRIDILPSGHILAMKVDKSWVSLDSICFRVR